MDNQSLPFREVERMMKTQDVILKAMANKITWLSAAEIIVGVRKMAVKSLAALPMPSLKLKLRQAAERDPEPLIREIRDSAPAAVIEWAAMLWRV